MREMREMGKIEARLISMGACSAAGVWVASLPPETTEEAAWSAWTC